MVWQVGGPKGHGAELMINIAIVSMHAILYIDILGPAFVMSGGAMAPLAPPVPPPIQCICTQFHNAFLSDSVTFNHFTFSPM